MPLQGFHLEYMVGLWLIYYIDVSPDLLCCDFDVPAVYLIMGQILNALNSWVSLVAFVLACFGAALCVFRSLLGVYAPCQW